MEITREFLQQELENMTKQRDHAHDVAVASQAAIDVFNALIQRLDYEESKDGNN